MRVNYLKSLLRMADLKGFPDTVANHSRAELPIGQLTQEAGRALLTPDNPEDSTQQALAPPQALRKDGAKHTASVY
jgi:hypothetical protein